MAHQPAGTVCNCGERGWMPGVEHVPVTWARPQWVRVLNGKMRPVVIVDHVMQGWLTTMVNYALQRGSDIRYVTPHFNIGTGGRCVQIESIFTPGIHASALNSPTARRVLARLSMSHGASLYSVGIEHEGFSAPIVGLTDTARAAIAAHWTPSNPWPDAMVAKSIEVKLWILEQCPEMGGASQDSIIGHSEIDAKNRPNDPQRATYTDVWPRDRMIAALTKPLALTAEQAEVVANIRAVLHLLSDTDVVYMLASVGLTELPASIGGQAGGSGFSPSPEGPKHEPPATPTLDRAGLLGLIDANERTLEQVESLVKDSRDRLTTMRRKLEV